MMACHTDDFRRNAMSLKIDVEKLQFDITFKIALPAVSVVVDYVHRNQAYRLILIKGSLRFWL